MSSEATPKGREPDRGRIALILHQRVEAAGGGSARIRAARRMRTTVSAAHRDDLRHG
jgi:hypothetical protein